MLRSVHFKKFLEDTAMLLLGYKLGTYLWSPGFVFPPVSIDDIRQDDDIGFGFDEEDDKDDDELS